MISFPVLKSLAIEKYGLIPPSKRNPFVIKFQPGQNAIVGVNGSGKSTLVNIALRCLTGPYNLPAATSGTEFGQVRARLVAMPKSERTMFARRVAGGGQDAFATIVVSFGEKTLEIKRQLSDLSLVSCLISDRLTDTTATDKQQFSDEPTYQAEISNCVGVAQFFDALIIFRFLVFMMEDRRTLVWDPSAQRQIFRVLLLPADRATEYASAQQDVVSRDSAVRNTQSVMNRHKGQVKAARSHAKNINDAEAERRVLSKQASVLREKIDQLAQARLQADKERQAGRLDRLKAARRAGRPHCIDRAGPRRGKRHRGRPPAQARVDDRLRVSFARTRIPSSRRGYR
jgi:energy-coupling factor transporter ATP-binding protein EcfA2